MLAVESNHPTKQAVYRVTVGEMRFTISITGSNLVRYEDLLWGNCETVGGGSVWYTSSAFPCFLHYWSAMREGVRFRELTADKERRQWNACQKDRDRGEQGYGADENRTRELWNNISLFGVKCNMNNSWRGHRTATVDVSCLVMSSFTIWLYLLDIMLLGPLNQCGWDMQQRMEEMVKHA